MEKIWELNDRMNYHALFAVFLADTVQTIITGVNQWIEMPNFDLHFTHTVEQTRAIPIFLILRQNTCAQVCYCIFDVNNIEVISRDGGKKLRDEDMSLLSEVFSTLELRRLYSVLEAEHIILLSQF